MRRSGDCLLLLLTVFLLFSCSSISLDDIEKEEAQEEKQKGNDKDGDDGEEDDSQSVVLTSTGETSGLLQNLTEIPATLSSGDFLCGMLVIDVEDVIDEENHTEYIVVTLLSNTEWMNVPSAYAEGDFSGHAQALANQCREAGVDTWYIPTKEQGKIIRSLCTNLSTDNRYLCAEAKSTYAVGSNRITKAGPKKRYGLRLVMDAYFEIE